METVMSKEAVAALSPELGYGLMLTLLSQLGVLGIYNGTLRWQEGKNGFRPFLANTRAPATDKHSL